LAVDAVQASDAGACEGAALDCYTDDMDVLQISQSALKVQITAARQHLRARTTAEAIQRAASYDLI
jgi:hypothetical protein